MEVAEANVRGLRALGIPAKSYWGLLLSILINKLPSELTIFVSREKTNGWQSEAMMKVLTSEVDAREMSVKYVSTASRRAPQ